MIFDLSNAHLGDVLMAMPAMRSTDAVIVPVQHRVPGAPVEWMDRGVASIWPAMRRGRHTTEAWLESTGRGPVRHRIMPARERAGVVIAPDVAVASKQWPRERWFQLSEALPEARVVVASTDRAAWMNLLNTAEVVICPDTGTAHMADALGCERVVALHGVPGNWPHCAPFWDRRSCIARKSMSEITVDDVLEVVRG